MFEILLLLVRWLKPAGMRDYFISNQVSGIMTDYGYDYFGKLWMNENTCIAFTYYEDNGYSGSYLVSGYGEDNLGYVVRCVQDI
jgi:hypothetical protein